MSPETVRRVGRPDQQASEELVRHILDVAARLFIEKGFSATSIEQIALVAGSGKQTIYRRFSSKEALFISVIERQGVSLVEAALSAAAPDATPLAALEQTCRSFLNFVLQPDLVALHRVLIAEVARFPALGEQVLNQCLSPFKGVVNGLILAAAQSGAIRVDDPVMVHHLLLGLVSGWPTQQALLGHDELATQADRDRYFDAAWAMFLGGVNAVAGVG